MPLTFQNRSRVMIEPRGVMAFTAHDGTKQVCCLVPLLSLERYFGAGAATAAPNPDALGRAFDRHRLLIEETASELYDRQGSDECGELLLRERDLRQREADRFAAAFERERRLMVLSLGDAPPSPAGWREPKSAPALARRSYSGHR